MRSSIQYTLLRLLVFSVCLLVLWLIPPLRDNVILLLFVAATVSMLISLFGLTSLRDRMSAEIAEKVEERHVRHDHKWDDDVQEDYEDEHPRGAANPTGETYR